MNAQQDKTGHNDTEQNDSVENDTIDKELNFRRRILIFGSTIVLVPILFFAVGYAIEMYHHHQTMRAIGEYTRACADANEPVELAGVFRCIQGNTARTVTAYKSVDIYNFTWTVYGVIETNKRLFVKHDKGVDKLQLGHPVVTVSQEPI